MRRQTVYSCPIRSLPHPTFLYLLPPFPGAALRVDAVAPVGRTLGRFPDVLRVPRRRISHESQITSNRHHSSTMPLFPLKQQNHKLVHPTVAGVSSVCYVSYAPTTVDFRLGAH